MYNIQKRRINFKTSFSYKVNWVHNLCQYIICLFITILVNSSRIRTSHESRPSLAIRRITFSLKCDSQMMEFFKIIIVFGHIHRIAYQYSKSLTKILFVCRESGLISLRSLLSISEKRMNDWVSRVKPR